MVTDLLYLNSVTALWILVLGLVITFAAVFFVILPLMKKYVGGKCCRGVESVAGSLEEHEKDCGCCKGTQHNELEGLSVNKDGR